MFKVRTSKSIRIIPILITVLFISIPAHAKYSGGTGEPNNPFQIATAQDLIDLGNEPNDYNKHFILTDDIDLASNLPDQKVFDKAVIIGYLNAPFAGVFNGYDHVIRNLQLQGNGLFGYLAPAAKISNLGIEDVNVEGFSDRVGALAGCNEGTITNCYSTGKVKGNQVGLDHLGGLVGFNLGSIVTCYSTCFIIGYDGIGGLVGTNTGTISDCYRTGMILGNSWVGGLVACNIGIITMSHNAGEVSGNDRVGGLVAGNFGSITTSCNTGTVLGDRYVGGLVGRNYEGEITASCSTGTVSGIGDYYGGLVGMNQGRIIASHSTGAVRGIKFVGGLVGSNFNGDIAMSYSTGKASGDLNIGGLVGENWQGSIITSYCTGIVNGKYFVGGLAGDSWYGRIATSYSTGMVSGDEIIGGLVGLNYEGIIAETYSTSKVSGNQLVGGFVGDNIDGSIFSSFWDIEKSGLVISDGGKDKTTAEMQIKSTFLNAGWDFIGETINGPNDIWWILEGKDYPRLWWQLPEDDFNDCNTAPLWLAYETEPDLAHLEEINGRLEVNTAGAMDSIDAIYIPYNWALDANKPFAVQVDFHFSKIGIGDGRINLGIVPSMDPYAMKWAELEAGTFDNNPFYLYEIRDGMWVEEQTCTRLLDDGTLYVSYDPNSDELYLSNTDYGKADAIWTVTGLIRGHWQCESLYFFLSGGSEGGMALTGENAWLDNFKVDEGVIRQ